MSDELHDITVEQVAEVAKLFPEENPDTMHVQLQFHSLQCNVKMSKMLAGYKSYIEMCLKEERDSKYIKKFRNFMDEGMWRNEHSYRNKSGNIAKQWLEGLI